MNEYYLHRYCLVADMAFLHKVPCVLNTYQVGRQYLESPPRLSWNDSDRLTTLEIHNRNEPNGRVHEGPIE